MIKAFNSLTNTIAIIPNYNQSKMEIQSEPQTQHKLKQAGKLSLELQYINPKKHRYFTKIYKLESELNEITLLLKDMQEYHSLIASQSKKITKFMYESHLNNVFNSLLISALQYFNQFTIQSSRFINKIANIHQSCVGNQNPVRELQSLCIQCNENMSNYRVKQIQQQLSLNKFQDRCNYFNVDNINYSDLIDLRRENHQIMGSQLGTGNEVEIRGTCLSLEQYDQVLNLLGSDLHQKNNSIQKIIHHFNDVDRKFIEESTFKERQSEEEMNDLHKSASGKTIENKLNSILRLSFNKYNKMKNSKRRDGEVQVCIKDNEVIRELQKEKKALKGRIYQLTLDKSRITTQYENKIKSLQLQMSSNANELQQQIGKLNIQATQLSTKFAQQFNLHQIHKKELQTVTNEYTNLRAIFNRSFNSRQRPSISKRTKGESKKKSRARGRTKKTIVRLASNFDINDQEESDSGQQSRVKRDSGKAAHIPNFQRRTSKVNFIEKVQGKHEQGDIINKLMSRKQASRFKAMVQHFNSNSQIPNEEKQKPQRLSFNSASLHLIKDAKSNKEGTVLPQIHIVREDEIKQGSQERNNILYKLFQTEREIQQLQINFPSFLQLYNNFINNISSQKLIGRSSSLGHSRTQQPFRQRVSILNDKHSSKHMQRNTISLKPFQKQSTATKSRQPDENSECAMQSRQSIANPRSKFQLLNKKSQYHLKKNSQKSIFDFSYSKTAQNTLRNNTLLPNSTHLLGPTFQLQIFSKEQIRQIFLNEANMTASKLVSEAVSKGQVQNLMNIYTELANINLKNKQYYQQIKYVLSHPHQIINSHPIPSQSNTSQIKNSLRYVFSLHGACKRQRGKYCLHICKFMQKIKNISRQQ